GGDAPLANFGLFATPARDIVFDVNDFDETFPGPWEWDLKRLMTSFVVAGRARRFSSAQLLEAGLTAVAGEVDRLRELARMTYLDVWYSRTEADEILKSTKGVEHARTQAVLDKARVRDQLHAQAKLTELVDGRRRIKVSPPLLQRAPFGDDDTFIEDTWHAYRASLPNATRQLMEHYHFADVALKVVGVGSVGT